MSVGLKTHIADVVNTIVWEELTDIVLVGHSYGGMVITGVADELATASADSFTSRRSCPSQAKASRVSSARGSSRRFRRTLSTA